MSLGETIQVVVELLRAHIEPLEDRHHPVVGVTGARVRQDLTFKLNEGRDCIAQTRELAVCSRGKNRAADHAAFELSRYEDRRAVHACLDLQPESGLGAADCREQPLHVHARRFDHSNVSPYAKRDASQYRAMQMRRSMPVCETEKLRALIRMLAEPFTRQ